MLNTIIIIALASCIGYLNDNTGPMEYYYGYTIVTLYDKYQCPSYCDVDHFHYVHYDSSVLLKGGMKINKDKLGKRYRPPK